MVFNLPVHNILVPKSNPMAKLVDIKLDTTGPYTYATTLGGKIANGYHALVVSGNTNAFYNIKCCQVNLNP